MSGEEENPVIANEDEGNDPEFSVSQGLSVESIRASS